MAGKSRLIFVTGSDTGVGKTVLTALLLAHLRAHDVRASALKPFCTGDQSDATQLASLQDNPPLATINRWFWPQPVAPLLAARQAGQTVALAEACGWLLMSSRRFDVTLIEGAGGLLSPLGEKFSAREIIHELGCAILAVVPNKLGAINQARLIAEAVRTELPLQFVLSSLPAADPSLEQSNLELIRELTGRAAHSLPYLGPRRAVLKEAKANAPLLHSIIAACNP